MTHSPLINHFLHENKMTANEPRLTLLAQMTYKPTRPMDNHGALQRRSKPTKAVPTKRTVAPRRSLQSQHGVFRI